tara:strand:- start:1039 stop:1653 length:615 start_codon:yes stop_codon:yes gene_type:complete
MIKFFLDKLLIFIIIFFLTQRASAQFSSYGLSAGIHISNLNVVPYSLVSNPLSFSHVPQRGYHIGGYYRTGLGLVYFQPQLWITILNHSLSYRDDISDITRFMELDLVRLDLPLEMGIKVGPFLALYAPVFSIPLGVNSNTDFQLKKSGGWSNQVGIGVKLMKFQFSVRYEGPITFSEALQVEISPFIYVVETSQIIGVISMGF